MTDTWKPRRDAYYSPRDWDWADALASRDVSALLVWMTYHGSSVTLNWGEGPAAWECSWISGGDRFTACRAKPGDALHDVIWKVHQRVFADAIASVAVKAGVAPPEPRP